MEPVVIGLSDAVDPGWVEVKSIREIERHVRAGRTVVVTPAALVPRPEPGAPGAEEAAEIAAACVAAWVGARVFRTARPRELTRALLMTESLAGRRRPAVTRRGLA